MELSVGKLLIVLVIVFVIFGAGKLPQVMNDLGKGIKSLKDGMKGDEAEKKAAEEQKRITDASKDRNV